MNNNRISYTIRPLRSDERALLDDFIYEAIFIPEGVEPPPRSIIEEPGVRVYVENWGAPDDLCLVAECDGTVCGAVWTRIIAGYGHLDDSTPEFAISLLPQYRGKGIGTALMRAQLELLRERGYKQTSLAVQKANYAVRMYKAVGFEIIDENEEEYIMLCRL